MTDFDAALGKLITARRESLGLNQTDVARLVSADGHRWWQPTMVRIESGRRPVRASELTSLARTLGVAVTDLIGPHESSALREWPRTARANPDAQMLRDYLGRLWTQVAVDRWEREDRAVGGYFAWIAEHFGPLREVLPEPQ